MCLGVSGAAGDLDGEHVCRREGSLHQFDEIRVGGAFGNGIGHVRACSRQSEPTGLCFADEGLGNLLRFVGDFGFPFGPRDKQIPCGRSHFSGEMDQLRPGLALQRQAQCHACRLYRSLGLGLMQDFVTERDLEISLETQAKNDAGIGTLAKIFRGQRDAQPLRLELHALLDIGAHQEEFLLIRSRSLQ